MNILPVLVNVFKNPALKALLSVLAGTIVTSIDSAFQHPTGGLSAALATNPQYALVFAAVAFFVHNLVSVVQYQPAPPPPPKAVLMTQEEWASTYRAAVAPPAMLDPIARSVASATAVHTPGE